MKKLRFWIGFGEKGNFRPKDRAWFWVIPADGNAPDLLRNAKFVEADDMEEAREELHAVVDKYFDHHDHMSNMDKAVEHERKKSHDQFLKLASSDSLSIDGVGDQEKSGDVSSDLLDLMDVANELGSDQTKESNT